MILAICDSPDILKVLRVVKIILLILRIIVPLCIVVPTLITAIKELTGSTDKSTTNTLDKLKNRCIAGVLIFLIPTIINLIVKISSNEENNYIACLDNATSIGIQSAYKNTAESAIDNYKKTLDNNYYNQAKKAINNLDDKDELNDELKTVEYYASIKEEINKLKNKYNENDYQSLKKEIENINDESIKDSLLEELGDAITSTAISKKYDSLDKIPFATTIEEIKAYMAGTNKLDSNYQTPYKGTSVTATVTDDGGVKRTFAIYLPYGYTNSKKYNVLLEIPGGYGPAVISGTAFVNKGGQFMKNIDLFSSLAYSGLSEEVIIVGVTYRMRESTTEAGKWSINEGVNTLGNDVNAILNYVVTNYSTYASSLSDIASNSSHFGIAGGSTGGAILSFILQNQTTQRYFGYVSFDQSAFYSMNNKYSNDIPLRLFIAQNSSNDSSHNAQKYIPKWDSLYTNITENKNAIGIKFGAYGHGGLSTPLCYYNVLVSFFRY